jgi:mycothiol system anti-sigma-R factor
MITCKDCIQALHPYVDRELSEDDIVQVRQHLDECPGCLHLYRFEESLRRLVRVRCREQQAPDALRERVLARLAEERLRREGARSALRIE